VDEFPRGCQRAGLGGQEIAIWLVLANMVSLVQWKRGMECLSNYPRRPSYISRRSYFPTIGFQV
jgi:hypothetical protein